MQDMTHFDEDVCRLSSGEGLVSDLDDLWTASFREGDCLYGRGEGLGCGHGAISVSTVSVKEARGVIYRWPWACERIFVFSGRAT
jgi:hypothetical protein